MLKAKCSNTIKYILHVKPMFPEQFYTVVVTVFQNQLQHSLLSGLQHSLDLETLCYPHTSFLGPAIIRKKTKLGYHESNAVQHFSRLTASSSSPQASHAL